MKRRDNRAERSEWRRRRNEQSDAITEQSGVSGAVGGTNEATRDDIKLIFKFQYKAITVFLYIVRQTNDARLSL
jgi:hypothetical protein